MLLGGLRNGYLAALSIGASLLATGCYGSNALPGASAWHVRAVPPTAAAGASNDVCAGRQKQPLNTTWDVDVGGAVRSFIVHVPASYDPLKPTPLVFNFHGYTMGPKLEDWLTRMSAKADAEGFILVYPEGSGSPTSFNAGNCCGDASKNRTDDVGYTRSMLDRLEADLCVDPRRVFATGMSNGGFMSHRLACDLSDRIAAIPPVAGVNATETCAPGRAVPVLDFHGTKDPTVPYGGKPDRHWPSVEEGIEAWVARDGCMGAPVETVRTRDTVCVSHTRCRDGAEVELCTVDGGGHTWPGGAPVPGIAGQGKTTDTISADDLIWSFFQRHPMPEPPRSP